MARRSAPPNAGPAYYGAPTQRRQLNDPNETAVSRFLREEVWAPDKLPGNINILTGVAVFLGGIFAMRNWGDMIVTI